MKIPILAINHYRVSSSIISINATCTDAQVKFEDDVKSSKAILRLGQAIIQVIIFSTSTTRTTKGKTCHVNLRTPNTFETVSLLHPFVERTGNNIFLLIKGDADQVLYEAAEKMLGQLSTQTGIPQSEILAECTTFKGEGEKIVPGKQALVDVTSRQFPILLDKLRKKLLKLTTPHQEA